MDPNLNNKPGQTGVIFLSAPTDDEVAQIIDLYRQAGWWEPGSDNEGLVKRLVAGSHCFAAAMLEGRIVGMARAISDGASDAYIQDVTVKDAHRHSGIATSLLRAVIERLTSDGIGWVALVAERGSEALYGGLGFFPMKGAVPMRFSGAKEPER